MVDDLYQLYLRLGWPCRVSFPFNVYLVAMRERRASRCWSTLPLWRKWCLRTGLVDDPGQRKIHDQPIPLAGGLAVMTGLLVPTLLACLVLWWQGAGGSAGQAPASATPASADRPMPALLDPHSAFLLQYGLGRRALELAGIFLGAFGMLWVGWLDDKHELRPGAKFAGQFLVAALVAASGARITLFVPSLLFSYAITILWILTVINAFNFMDNMNGLCAASGRSGPALRHHCGGGRPIPGGPDRLPDLRRAARLPALQLSPRPRLSGRCRQPPRRLPAGGAGDSAALLYRASSAPVGGVDSPAGPGRSRCWTWFGSSVLRWRIGQPFYQGDTNHLSHRLVRRGLTRVRRRCW